MYLLKKLLFLLEIKDIYVQKFKDFNLRQKPNKN